MATNYLGKGNHILVFFSSLVVRVWCIPHVLVDELSLYQSADVEQLEWAGVPVGQESGVCGGRGTRRGSCGLLIPVRQHAREENSI